jgi:hypothetical protein
MLSSAQAIYGRPSYGFMSFLNCPNIDVAPRNVHPGAILRLQWLGDRKRNNYGVLVSRNRGLVLLESRSALRL